MRTKSPQLIKKLILRLRSLISKWFQLKTITIRCTSQSVETEKDFILIHNIIVLEINV